jgi:hypothetical protein
MGIPLQVAHGGQSVIGQDQPPAAPGRQCLLSEATGPKADRPLTANIGRCAVVGESFASGAENRAATHAIG